MTEKNRSGSIDLRKPFLLKIIIKISLQVSIYRGKLKADACEGEEEGVTTLKCLQEHKHNTKFEPSVDPDKPSINGDDDLIDLFPLPRYFQVHFEHIHENSHDVKGKLNHLNHDIQSQLDQLKQTLATVEGKLDRFIALLTPHIEPEHRSIVDEL